MKKLLALFLCALALLSLSACTTQADVDAAYERGYKAGYEEGLSVGRSEAREECAIRCPIDPYDYEQAYEKLHSVVLSLEEYFYNGTRFDVGLAFTLLDDARSIFSQTMSFLYYHWG